MIIPTYNRCGLLGRTLETLVDQQVAAGGFEVVVADDGSTDETRKTVDGFADRLRIRYFHQPDEGFRAGTARNQGARRATAPVLIFLDTGMLVGPDFVRAHLAAQTDPELPGRAAPAAGQAVGGGTAAAAGRAGESGGAPAAGQAVGGGGAVGRAVLGYTYGYNRFEPYPGLTELLADRRPAEVVARLGADEAFRDMRHVRFDRVGFDLDRLVAPWWLFWSLNVSVRAEDFWAVGGFDEDFRSWGLEDVELGYRLTRRGVPTVVSRQAWAVDHPHERDVAAESSSSLGNARLFLDKHPEPIPELLWGRYAHTPRMNFEDACRELVAWTDEVHHRQVSDEIATAVEAAGLGSAARIAVLGCGGVIPATLPAPATLVDFDAALLRRALADGRHRGGHGVGLQTRRPDDSYDLVVVTSRLAGLWDRWGEPIRAEAHRIGRAVTVTLD